MELSSVNAKSIVKVVSVKSGKTGKRFLSFGITKGSIIRVLRRESLFGGMVIEVEGCLYAIRKEAADLIVVAYV